MPLVNWKRRLLMAAWQAISITACNLPQTFNCANPAPSKMKRLLLSWDPSANDIANWCWHMARALKATCLLKYVFCHLWQHNETGGKKWLLHGDKVKRLMGQCPNRECRRNATLKNNKPYQLGSKTTRSETHLYVCPGNGRWLTAPSGENRSFPSCS